MLIWVNTNPTSWGKCWSALVGGILNLELLPQASHLWFLDVDALFPSS